EAPRSSAGGLAAFVFSEPRWLRPDSAGHGSATGVGRAHAAPGPGLRILLWLPPRQRHRPTTALPHAGRARRHAQPPWLALRHTSPLLGGPTGWSARPESVARPRRGARPRTPRPPGG